MEVIDETSIKDTEDLLNSSGTMKEKEVYIAGFLTHKLKQHDGDPSEEDSCRFLEELNRGSLRVPTLNTVFFVHSAQYTYEHLDESRMSCISYFKRLISHIDAPMAAINGACRTLSNLVFKARAIAVSDRENTLGCLRRKEKLSTK